MSKFNTLVESIMVEAVEYGTRRIAGKKYEIYHDSKHWSHQIIVVDPSTNDPVAFAKYGQSPDGKRVTICEDIYGPGFGELLYGAMSVKSGKLLPSLNESDLAKKAWRKMYDGTESAKWKKEKYPRTWGYKAEEGEDYLNHTYELQDKSGWDIKELKDTPDEDKIDKEVDELWRKLSGHQMRNMKTLYTIGYSAFKKGMNS